MALACPLSANRVICVANFIEKASRLYEQKRSAVLAATALEMYVRRWLRWATSGDIAKMPPAGIQVSTSQFPLAPGNR
jgi:hypothetical protein